MQLAVRNLMKPAILEGKRAYCTAGMAGISSVPTAETTATSDQTRPDSRTIFALVHRTASPCQLRTVTYYAVISKLSFVKLS